jgi:NhaP-type Na+/H+ or K+/H+ antiporter
MNPYWFVLIGALLLFVALLGRFLDRLPVSLAIIYLAVGFLLGPAAFDAIELHPMRHLVLLESISEIALLVALFTVGIKMRVPIGDGRWGLPLRLATLSMVITICGVALVAALLFGFSWGIALLLGAALAPTDPVLASDVQLRTPEDRDRLRFALTAEGGLNDGTAFPFVFLGLGLIGLHELGPLGLRWIAVDVIWGAVGGLGIGFIVGDGIARGVRWLRRLRQNSFILDEFLLLGVIALAYGAAVVAGSLGFLAVFAAGLALRRADDRHADSRGADKSPLTPSMLSVNEQLERIVEVAIVLLVGAMISAGYWSGAGVVIGILLFVVIRPVAVCIAAPRSGTGAESRRLLGWFGIRGIGSVYYAVFIAGHEIPYGDAIELLSCVFTVIALSILVHGISATPLMDLYRRRRAPPQRDAVSDKP